MNKINLIDREAAAEILEARADMAVLTKAQSAFLYAANMIRSLPAVDAEPVRHGYWIHCKGKSNLWYCSECGEKIMYNPTRKTYGPNKKAVYEVNMRCRRCGANMVLEEKRHDEIHHTGRALWKGSPPGGSQWEFLPSIHPGKNREL